MRFIEGLILLVVLGTLGVGIANLIRTDRTLESLKKLDNDFQRVNAPPEHIFSHVGGSPITAAGGSITIRSKGDWKDGQAPIHTSTTVASIDASEIEVEGLLPTSTDEPSPAGWSGITRRWEITMYALDSNGQIKADKGVKICTSDSNGNCSGSDTFNINSTNVAISTIGNGTALIEKPSPVGGYTRQYQDSGCQVSNKQLCEYPGRVDFSFGGGSPHSYNCQHGACRIFIGR